VAGWLAALKPSCRCVRPPYLSPHPTPPNPTPPLQIIGVEPSGANAMAMSLAKGQRVTLSKVDGFADGVAVKQVGAETFRLCRQLVDGVVLVDNAAISGAIKDVFNETRSILEPAGAVAVAGAKAWLKATGSTGRTVVAVTSGANINFERLRLVSELADLGSSTEVSGAALAFGWGGKRLSAAWL